MKKTNTKKPASKYAKKLELRKKLSGNRYYITTNQGQAKKLPFPEPLFQDA